MDQADSRNDESQRDPGENALDLLASRLDQRLQAYAEAHPEESGEDWLFRVIDGWAADEDRTFRQAPGSAASTGLPVLQEPACQPGCDHCCHQIAMVTALEAQLLARHLLRNWSEAEIDELRRRATDLWNRARSAGIENRPLAEQMDVLARIRRPCPLLEESSRLCLAYEARPLACRRENSTDAEVCRRYRENPDEAVASLRVPRLERIWNAARRLLNDWIESEDAGFPYMPLELALVIALEDH